MGLSCECILLIQGKKPDHVKCSYESMNSMSSANVAETVQLCLY